MKLKKGEGWVCLISKLLVFVVLVLQVLNDFFEKNLLFVKILDVLIGFLNLSLEFMLLTRFDFLFLDMFLLRIKYERSNRLRSAFKSLG